MPTDDTNNDRHTVSETKKVKDVEIFVKLGTRDRLSFAFRSSFTHTAIAAIVGLLSSLITTAITASDLLEKLTAFFRSNKTGSLDLFISTAFAASGPTQSPAFSGLLKSAILSGIFVALFILFLWALYTLSKSTNTKAIDAAVDAVKMLAGFFIGALTGFLGT